MNVPGVMKGGSGAPLPLRLGVRCTVSVATEHDVRWIDHSVTAIDGTIYWTSACDAAPRVLTD